MPFGAIKDLMSRGGRKAAKTTKRAGKKAYSSAKEFDEQMQETHGGTDSPGEAFGSFGRDMDPSGPDLDLGVDRGDTPNVPDALGDGGDDTPRVPDAMGGGRSRKRTDDDWFW